MNNTLTTHLVAPQLLPQQLENAARNQHCPGIMSSVAGDV
jgi:hypothetical protein